jgi:restriction endonuclease Mrr
MEQIRQRRVLHDVLLQVLAEHTGGLPIHEVYDLVDAQYRFPEEWYRQIPSAQGYEVLKGLGFANWRDVPQELLTRLVTTEPQWQNEIRWSRNELRKEGFLDMSAGRGHWRLTPAGVEAAARLDMGELTEPERLILTTRQPVPEQRKPSLTTAARTDLLKKLQMYTHSMPIEDLEMLVEIAWAVRKRSVPLELDVA